MIDRQSDLENGQIEVGKLLWPSLQHRDYPILFLRCVWVLDSDATVSTVMYNVVLNFAATALCSRFSIVVTVL